ncbi:MAG: flagellin [Gammaproteobacteria bacterium]
MQNVSENTAASRSRINDFDFASGVSEQARNNILQQINLAVQAQANISGQNTLQLLS